jgi:chromosome segregation ATPase
VSETEDTQPPGTTTPGTTTADTKACRYPGCTREPEPTRGPGRPTQFCNDPEHNKTTAFHARRRIKKDAAAAAGQVTTEDPARPVDYSAARTRELLPIAQRLASELKTTLGGLVEQLETLTDPGAAAVEVETTQAAAAEAVAEAETARLSADKERREAVEQREDADELAEEAQEAARQAKDAQERTEAQAAQKVEEAKAAARQARAEATRQIDQARTQAQAKAEEIEAAAAQRVEEAEAAARQARDEATRQIDQAEEARRAAQAEAARHKATAQAAQADRERLIKEHSQDRERWRTTLEEERTEFRGQLAAATERATKAYREADTLRRELAGTSRPQAEEEPPADEATLPAPESGRRRRRATAAKP